MKRKTVSMAHLDRVFCKTIHEAYDYTCAYLDCPFCWNDSMRGSGGLVAGHIECAHYYNRYRSSGRWHPDNVAGLCHGAHAFLEHNKALEVQFFTKLLGETRHDWLVERHQGVYRYKPWERWEMAQHYTAQRKHIERRRVEHLETGFIEVVSWD